MIINDITFRYGDKTIFENYTLSLNEGIYCLMGPSASGKTTLLKLMAGLLQPEAGNVDPENKTAVMMFQEDRLLQWYDAEKNVELIVGNEKKAEIEKMFEYLEIPLNGNVKKLSGGQKRRIALIRALLAEGDVLLLDEPFTGMDKELTKKAIELIKKQNNLTVVATHSLEEVKLLEAEIINI